MRKVCSILLTALVSVAAVTAAPRSQPRPKHQTPTYWYRIVARWNDESSDEYLFVSQPKPGVVVGELVWPHVDEQGRPYIRFMRLDGKFEKGRAWLASGDHGRYIVDFAPERFAAASLTVRMVPEGTQLLYRRSAPPPLANRPWRNALTDQP